MQYVSGYLSDHSNLHPPNPRTQKMPGGYRALSFQHITALTLVLTLAATSAVSLSDVLFVLLSLPYLRLLSALTFPPPSSSSPPPPVFSPQENRYLAIYVSVGGLVGLLLPLLHMLHCFFAKDIVSIHASAPHLFLLSAQIFLEGVSFGYDFSLPARAAVPIIYNTKRLFTITAWVQRVAVGGGLSVGVVIALANAAFWGFNLLGFLLPVYLPRALKLYYCSERSDNKSS